ncbi:MAG: PAS domain S-box protein, partial [Rhodospirillaceae bacterium]
MMLLTRAGGTIRARFNATALLDAEGRISDFFALVIDLTADRQQQELKSGQERLRQIISAVPFAMIVTRPSDGRVLYVNPHATELFGLSEQGGLNLNDKEFWIDPAQRERFISAVWANGRVDSLEVEMKRQDGTGFWSVLSAQLFVYDGDTALLVGCQDTDRLKRTERALSASEARSGTIIANAGFGIAVCDTDGCIVQANPAFARLLGLDASELAGRPWLDFTHPEDRERSASLSADLIAGRIERYDLEKRFVTSDGRTVWGSLVISRIPAEPGQPPLTVAMIEDITGRKAAELTLRTLSRAVEHAPVSVMITDVCGRIEYTNPETERVTGYAQADIIGLNPRIFQSGHVPHDVYRVLWDTILSGEVWRGQLLNRKRNGDLFWEDGAIAPVRDEQGVIRHFVGLKQDITARKQAETALVRAREDAEQANRAKSQFLATMSHELRTPLNTILGFSEVIRDELMGPQAISRYIEYANDIHESGTHLLTLINDILDLAKIEAGKLELARTELYLPGVLAAVVRLVSVRALEAGLFIGVECPADLPSVMADERGIKQILFNLLSNAIKFTPAGGKITVRANADHNGTTVLTITDTGVGIPADQLSRVLRPFEQVDNRYCRSAGGTGLGLALVNALIELYQPQKVFMQQPNSEKQL